MGRGDVRAALLVLLDEQPHTGYSLIEEIERCSYGALAPEPEPEPELGLPDAAQLEDEGLVRAEEGEGRTQFTRTDAGNAYVEENRREELGEPWAKPAAGVGEERLELRGLVAQIGGRHLPGGRRGGRHPGRPRQGTARADAPRPLPDRGR